MITQIGLRDLLWASQNNYNPTKLVWYGNWFPMQSVVFIQIQNPLHYKTLLYANKYKMMYM